MRVVKSLTTVLLFCVGLCAVESKSFSCFYFYVHPHSSAVQCHAVQYSTIQQDRDSPVYLRHVCVFANIGAQNVLDS